MKKNLRIFGLLIVVVMIMSLFGGCGLGLGGGEEEDKIATLAESIKTAISAAGSVEASVFLDIQAHIGTTGTTGSHTASVESDITIQSTFAPYAYHSETFSRILVDTVSTREDTELYVVPIEQSSDYAQYAYNAKEDVWTKQTLTLAEIESLSLKTALLRDWEPFLRTARLDAEGVNCNGKTTNRYVGDINSNILQVVMNDGIFGSFLHSVEQLLNEEVSCTLFIEQETNLPVQMFIDFREEFTVSDMSFDQANITVDYTDWGKSSEVSVPKKVSVVSHDKDDEFYASFFAWNLFLPYLQSAVNPNGPTPGGNESFTASWETFQIRIDNGVTALPILYTDLNKLGYTIDSNYSNIIVEPNMYVERIPVFKGQDLIYCSFYNDNTEAMPISSCKIGCFDISAADQKFNGISVFLPGDIALGATLEYVISAYDTADETSKAFSADTYIWRIPETENQSLLIEINPQTNEVIRLQLTYIPVTGGKQ